MLVMVSSFLPEPVTRRAASYRPSSRSRSITVFGNSTKPGSSLRDRHRRGRGTSFAEAGVPSGHSSRRTVAVLRYWGWCRRAGSDCRLGCCGLGDGAEIAGLLRLTLRGLVWLWRSIIRYNLKSTLRLNCRKRIKIYCYCCCCRSKDF